MKKIIILTAIIVLVLTGLSFAAQKTITTYMRAGDMGIQMPLDPGGFVPNPSDPLALTGNLVDRTLSMGNDIKDASGSYIYGGDSDIAYCVAGKCIFGIGVRVYFEFTFQDTDTSSDSTAQADGFTFTIFNGSNNTKNSTGGAPAGISMGELIGYAGPGRTNGLGLQPPKMAIEFDTYPNPGNTNLCAAGSRNDADNNNHMALMFWGDNTTGNCTNISYPISTFDDNKHGAGTGDNPVNSYTATGSYSCPSDPRCGYYAGAKNGSYNWLEDGQLHRFRMEITRATTPVSSKYAYNIKAWVDCPSCTADQLNTFKNVTVPYIVLTPQINRTVSLVEADHLAFNTMLFGWTFATGGSTQRTSIQNFDLYFPRSPCGYGTNPASASLSSAAQSGNINVLATAGCTWTAVSDPLKTWLTITSGGSGTGNSTIPVIYHVDANNAGAPRTGNITIGDYIFKVNQKVGQTIGAITFAPSTLILGGITTASATATSGLAVTFTSTTPTTCTVSGTNGSIVTGVALGTCTIAANQAGNASYEVAPQVTGNITVCSLVTINTTSLSNGTAGTTYSQTLSASGGTITSWAIASGSLPGGLSLNTSTGVISGTPTTAGIFSFTVRATNSCGASATSGSLTITIVCSSYRVWNNTGSQYDFKVTGQTCHASVNSGSEITTSTGSTQLGPLETVSRFTTAGAGCSSAVQGSITYTQAVNADTNYNCQVNYNSGDTVGNR